MYRNFNDWENETNAKTSREILNFILSKFMK
jgi:hypothetical protein